MTKLIHALERMCTEMKALFKLYGFGAYVLLRYCSDIVEKKGNNSQIGTHARKQRKLPLMKMEKKRKK
jgi:hypothetical protein